MNPALFLHHFYYSLALFGIFPAAEFRRSMTYSLFAGVTGNAGVTVINFNEFTLFKRGDGNGIRAAKEGFG